MILFFAGLAYVAFIVIFSIGYGVARLFGYKQSTEQQEELKRVARKIRERDECEYREYGDFRSYHKDNKD